MPSDRTAPRPPRKAPDADPLPRATQRLNAKDAGSALTRTPKASSPPPTPRGAPKARRRLPAPPPVLYPQKKRPVLSPGEAPSTRESAALSAAPGSDTTPPGTRPGNRETKAETPDKAEELRASEEVVELEELEGVEEVEVLEGVEEVEDIEVLDPESLELVDDATGIRARPQRAVPFPKTSPAKDDEQKPSPAPICADENKTRLRSDAGERGERGPEPPVAPLSTSGAVLEEIAEEEVETGRLDNVVSGEIATAVPPARPESAASAHPATALQATVDVEDTPLPAQDRRSFRSAAKALVIAAVFAGVGTAGYVLGQQSTGRVGGSAPVAKAASSRSPRASQSPQAPHGGENGNPWSVVPVGASPAPKQMPAPVLPSAKAEPEPVVRPLVEDQTPPPEASPGSLPEAASEPPGAARAVEETPRARPSSTSRRREHRRRQRRRTRQRATTSRPRQSTPTGDPGILMVGAKPPCKITIDGTDTGLKTPQRKLRLSPGRHRVTLHNAEHDLSESFTVSIHSGKRTKIIKDLTDSL